MDTFKSLEQTVLKYIKDKVKLGSISKDQLLEVLRFQISDLESIKRTFETFDDSTLQTLRSRYIQLTPTKGKYDVSKFIPALNSQLKGTAAAYEKKVIFGAAKVSCKTLKSILTEVVKNIDDLLNADAIVLQDSKITSVMVLGVIREADVFIKYTGFLWDHFVRACTTKDTQVLGYRAEYLNAHFSEYVGIINSIIEKEHNFSFLKDVGDVRKKQSDLVLYANGQTFRNFLNSIRLSASSLNYLNHGILGFNMFTWVLSLWDDWKHERYLKNRDFKEWLEQSATLLRLEANNHDPNSPEYQRLMRIIEAYDKKIVDYDRKLNDYEKE